MATPTNQNAFKDLEFSFRGIALPCVDRSHQFSHEQTPHHVLYRDGVAIDMLGIQARTFRYSCPMRDGVTAGHTSLFAKTFRLLYEAFRDKTPGFLVDQVHGRVLVVPGAWDEQASPSKGVDGVDVSLTFVEHSPVDEVWEDDPPTIVDLTDQENRLDADVAVTPWTKQVPAPPVKPNILAAVAGAINQVNRTREQSRAAVLGVADKANRIEEASEKLGIAGEPTRAAARRMRLDATNTANNPPRSPGDVKRIVTSAPQGVAELAAALGMTVRELLTLNPNLGRSPNVPRNTEVWGRKDPTA